MLTVILENSKNSPFHLFFVATLFFVAICGYLLFNTWHNQANAADDINENQIPSFILNSNHFGQIDTQNPVILNPAFSSNPIQNTFNNK